MVSHNEIEEETLSDNEVAEVLSTEEITQKYLSLLESVNLINEIIAIGDDDSESEDTVERNKKYLSNMLEKDFWTDEDMTAVNAAIAT